MSDARPSTLDPRPLRRRGLTLIELLVTILIIAILAGLILGVAAVAGETAREAETRHIVARLHNLLMEHYDTYKTRRVRLRLSDSNTRNGIEDQIDDRYPTDPSRPGYDPRNAARRGAAKAEARLYALREMMLMEMPDRWSNVLLTQVGSAPQEPLYLAGRTDLSNVYLRRYQGLLSRTNSLSGNMNTVEEIKRNQGAECLYMVITLATGDGEARSLFGESSIGDTDGDGAPEFLDGWEHPIAFLRWAPGFDSLIQLNLNTLGMLDPAEANREVAKDHDPFDVFRVDPIAFRLVPLIYSAGRDEEVGVFDGTEYDPIWRTSTSKIISFRNNPPYIISAPQLSPYATIGSGAEGYLGTAIDETATDNVHNHLLGQR